MGSKQHLRRQSYKMMLYSKKPMNTQCDTWTDTQSLNDDLETAPTTGQMYDDGSKFVVP